MLFPSTFGFVYIHFEHCGSVRLCDCSIILEYSVTMSPGVA